MAALIPFGFVVTVRRRPRFALLTGVSLALTCFFAASYDNADIDRYYLGPILIAWVWLAMLVAWLSQWLAAAVGPIAGRRPAGPTDPAGPGRTGRIGAAIALILAAVLLAPSVLAAPTRLAAVDESADRSASDWTDHVLGLVARNAVVVSWWSYSTPLWYAQRVEGRRPDLTIVDDRTRLDEGLGDFTDVIDANLGIRPVYVIRSDPADVARLVAEYELQPVDGAVGYDLTLVVARRAAGS